MPHRKLMHEIRCAAFRIGGDLEIGTEAFDFLKRAAEELQQQGGLQRRQIGIARRQRDEKAEIGEGIAHFSNTSRVPEAESATRSVMNSIGTAGARSISQSTRPRSRSSSGLVVASQRTRNACSGRAPLRPPAV